MNAAIDIDGVALAFPVAESYESVPALFRAGRSDGYGAGGGLVPLLLSMLLNESS